MTTEKTKVYNVIVQERCYEVAYGMKLTLIHHNKCRFHNNRFCSCKDDKGWAEQPEHKIFIEIKLISR